MKRTYVNRLPKNEEVKNTNVRIENGELIVEVDFKEKFQPKDGDFLVDKDGCVFIYSRPFNDCYGCYAGSYCDGTIHAESEVTWIGKAGCRYATPEEKYDFLERLGKECGKRWNPETKQIEDIRWRADKYCTYYYVDERGNVLGCNDTRGCASDSRYSCGNYFKTREAAIPYAEQIKEIFKNSKAE